MTTKKIICGFICDAEKSFALTIPELISIICIFYYYHFERFSRHGDKIAIDDEMNIATKITKNGFNTVYGDFEINDYL